MMMMMMMTIIKEYKLLYFSKIIPMGKIAIVK